MDLGIYQINLAGLLVLCGLTFVASRSSKLSRAKSSLSKSHKEEMSDASQRPFYIVYCLVMGADWLQGPFLYSLYRDEHGVSSGTISTLFTTGFVAGAIGGYFVGSLADRFGRRAACLVFCSMYAASCILTMVPSLPLLFMGRVLGGVSTSLLFSVFESWMVTDFHHRGLQTKGLDLSRTFGTMSTLNSLVAIGSGVVSEWVVSMFDTRKAPFVLSTVFLGLAAVFISSQWDENYGDTGNGQVEKANDGTNLPAILRNKEILSLGLASTMFEGSMYLFVFFWAPALRASQTLGSADLPYGVIFASFMASMMAASLLFNRIMDKPRPSLGHATLLIGVLGTATLCLLSLATSQPEQRTFWLFCAFEACVGMYWPCMGWLKGRVVSDNARAQVYGLLRIPLNIFVVVSLIFAREGGDGTGVFRACAGFLFLGAGALAIALRGTT